MSGAYEHETEEQRKLIKAQTRLVLIIKEAQ